MTTERVHYLPILVIVIFPVTFVLTYAIAVYREDVTPLFPYISDTGTFSPESCIFGQFLNLGAMIMALISYIRYLQLIDLYENNRLPAKIKKLNFPTCIMGILAALGISIVGNFQETNSLTVHLTGAMLAFGVGGIYISLQSYISFKIQHLIGNNTLCWLRVVLSAGTIIFFLLGSAFASVAFKHADPDIKTTDQTTFNVKWKPGEPGWTWHFMSTLSEWILAMSLILFLFTFVYDFKRISLTMPTVNTKLK